MIIGPRDATAFQRAINTESSDNCKQLAGCSFSWRPWGPLSALCAWTIFWGRCLPQPSLRYSLSCIYFLILFTSGFPRNNQSRKCQWCLALTVRIHYPKWQLGRRHNNAGRNQDRWFCVPMPLVTSVKRGKLDFRLWRWQSGNTVVLSDMLVQGITTGVSGC